MTTLIDELIHDNERKMTATGKQTLVRARRFVLDADASELLGEAIYGYPDLLVRNGEFAIPPFEKTWIEFECRPMFQGLKQTQDEEADLKVGYLITGNSEGYYDVQIAASSPGKEAGFVPYTLVLGRHATLEAEIKFAEWFRTSRMQLDKFYWGHGFSEILDSETKAGLRKFGGVGTRFLSEHLDRRWRNDDSEFDQFVDKLGPGTFLGGAGELRNLIAILLLLNQPSHTTYLTDVPSSRRMTSRGPKPFVSYSKVQIHLGRRMPKVIFKPVERQFRSGTRWHEVRGHFCHNRTGRSRACIHDWQETEPRRWECSKCGGKRWWRECPNGRGDAAIGFVKGMHEVKS